MRDYDKEPPRETSNEVIARLQRDLAAAHERIKELERHDEAIKQWRAVADDAARETIGYLRIEDTRTAADCVAADALEALRGKP